MSEESGRSPAAQFFPRSGYQNVRSKPFQKGLGLVPVILGSLFLFATLLWAIAGTTSSVQGVPIYTATNQLAGQAQYLRAAILACVTNYPNGNNGGAYHLVYPRADTAINASTATCPGNSSANVFTGNGGFGYVPPVTGFGAGSWATTGGWQYINDGTSVRLTITEDSTSWDKALSNVATQIGSQAVKLGTTLTVTITL